MTSRRRAFRSGRNFPVFSNCLCIHGRDSAVCRGTGGANNPRSQQYRSTNPRVPWHDTLLQLLKGRASVANHRLAGTDAFWIGYRPCAMPAPFSQQSCGDDRRAWLRHQILSSGSICVTSRIRARSRRAPSSLSRRSSAHRRFHTASRCTCTRLPSFPPGWGQALSQGKSL